MNKFNLFSFAKSKIQPFSLTNKQSTFVRYWKRFFALKINWLIVGLIIAFLLFIYLSIIFYPYQPYTKIENNILFNGLPNYSSPLVFQKFTFDSPIYELIKQQNAIDPRIIISETQAVDKVNVVYDAYLLLETIYHKKFILFFGTNANGFSRFSNLIHSLGWTIWFTISISILQMLLGVLLGTIFGYFSKKKAIQISYFLFNTFTIIPFLIIIILIFQATAYTNLKAVLFLTLFGFINFFYLAYNKTISICNQEYILSYKTVGLGNFRIICKYILPQVLMLAISLITENISLNILVLSSLAFFNVKGLENTLNIGNIFKQIIIDYSNVSYVVFAIVLISGFVLLTKLFGINLYVAYNPKEEKRRA
ncbi:ABC transporter permease subunit [Mycoplasmopsis iners]|uniref:ABC transporter permease subunit n=1 Tax=Mycoplasmopsis iners TaxID=76630 RepID=UPI00068B7E2D|nr:ABC transporter permease subunit [Mycoplasmopsis iners]